MSSILHLRRTLLAALALCVLCGAARGQNNNTKLGARLPELGEIRGVATLQTRDTEAEFAVKSYLAVWYFNLRPNQTPHYETFLVIFEPRQEGYREVFRHDAEHTVEHWSGITPLGTPLLPGLYIKISETSDYDRATVIAFVDGKFRVAFEGGTSELVDLDSDGFPEVFESDWPDGDGHPKTTRVHVWDGTSYRPLMKTAFRQRFNLPVLRAVERAARRPQRARKFS